MKKLSTTWICPHCGAVIPADDVNVAQDVALCRGCGQTSRFSDLVRDEEEATVNLDKIPERISVLKTMNGLEVSCKFKKGTAIFLIAFALIWDAVVSIFVVQCITGFMNGRADWFTAVFMIPFIVIGVAVPLLAVYVLFGRMKLTLNPGRGELFYGLCGIGRHKSFLLSKEARILIEMSDIQQNNRQMEEIVIEQAGDKPFKFGAMLDDREALNYLVAVLKAMRE